MDRMVLVVEDNATLRSGLVALLRMSDFGASGAASVAEATAYLDAAPQVPTHVFLDLNLPDGPGTAVLRAVRGRSMPVRVALMTGASDSGLIEQAQALGVDAVFIKPPDWDELLDWVAKA